MHVDFLVIGSGIAGLSYALKTAKFYPDKKILVITKTDSDETNTKYAQGGIAGVWDEKNDSFEKHIEDTLIAGDGLCNSSIVDIVVKEGPSRIREIIDYGAQFDKNELGDFSLGKEGGHSESRILHHKDVTGKEMERTLLEKVALTPNITLINHCFVLDLITQHHFGYLVTKSTPDITCYGVYVFNQQTNKIEKILSLVTLLATGGCGQVYRTTTNPRVATGDGVAMVYRAKGRIENMEFIQFHPTALYEPGVSPSFLITEAVRGDGGILRNKNGVAFMESYDVRADLAPRDIVARAIDNEMKRSGTEHVYLDCTHIPTEKFIHHFPNIYEKCLSIGINVAMQYIPVAPAAHYSCGGIKTDEFGRTSIKHLYAVGECASTGLHGANRLASNSLLEAMVFAERAFQDVQVLYGTGKLVLGCSDNITMRLHYKAPDVYNSNKVFEFTVSDKTHHFNNIKVDRSNTGLKNLEQKRILTEDDTHDTAYSQPISGTMIKLRFPTLRNILISPNYGKILKAILVVRPIKGSYTKPYTLPQQLRLSITNALNNLGSDLTANAGAYSASTVQYGNLTIDNLYGDNTYYSYDLSNYLKYIINDASANQNGLLLVPPSPAFETQMNRLVIGGRNSAPTNRIELQIYYAAIK